VKILKFCGLPWAYTQKTDCSIAASRRKILSSLFGSRGEITALTDEKYSANGYPVELSISPADHGENIAAELIRRGYTESARSDRVITLVRGSRERVRILLQSDGDLMHTLSQLGRTVTVTADRPAGSTHPDHPDMVYPVNYGYVSGISSGDGEWMDAYILGVCEPLSEFTGTVSAVIHRFDDCDDKLIVTPAGVSFSFAEIAENVNFCEKYFDSAVICPAQ